MAKVDAFHSKRETDPKVYHDNTMCTEANSIATKDRASGTGGHPKCTHCARLK